MDEALTRPVALWSLRAGLLAFPLALLLTRVPMHLFADAPPTTRRIVLWLCSYAGVMGLQACWWSVRAAARLRHRA
jgi:hypothetical protein